MKLRWEDVYDIFDDASLWENGHDMYWYRLMWGLMEYKNMNCYYDENEKMKVISKAFAIIKIYMDFIGKCFNDEEFEETIEEYTGDIFNYLYDDSDVHEIFSILKKELGAKRTFYSMFITCVEFKNGQISYEEYDEYDDNEDEIFDEYCGDYFEYEEDDESAEYFDEYEYCSYDETDDSTADNPEYKTDELTDKETFEIFYGECSEDYYYSFETYLQVLASSSMSMLTDITPEKAAGFIYLVKNMKSDA